MKNELQANVAIRLRAAMIIEGVTATQLAKRARVKRRWLKKFLRAEKDIDLRTLSDLFFYLGGAVRFHFEPINPPAAKPNPAPADTTTSEPAVGEV